MTLCKLLTALGLCVMTGLACATVRHGWVSKVMDGDTLWVLLDGSRKHIKVRVKDIDAPERCQPGGEVARKVMMGLALRQRVKIESVVVDVYGRQVARVMRGELDIGAEMVRMGMAWAYRYRTGKGPYARLQMQAQHYRKGVFASQETVISPPTFRKLYGNCYGA